MRRISQSSTLALEVRSMKTIAAIAIAAALTASLTLGEPAQTAEVQFKAAQHKEEIEGDLKGAISDYKKLAEGKDRALAARSLIRLATIYRKQSDAEAQ